MRNSTLFLKFVVVLMGLPVMAMAIFVLPGLVGILGQVPRYADLQAPVLLYLYTTAIPFYFALFQTFRLLRQIDRGEAFSILSVRALRSIKRSAVTISALYVFALPAVYLIAEIDDAPGLILLGAFVVFSSAVIAVFAAVLQQLLDAAIAIKSELDLTV